MSRSRRVVDLTAVDGDVWDVVDRWADREVDPLAVRARWSGRALPARGTDRFVDVTGTPEEAVGALEAAGLDVHPLRPKRVVGRSGTVAYPTGTDVVSALAEAGVAYRVVDRARRYVWRGPMSGPAICELSVSRPGTGPGGAGIGELLVEAWHEPVLLDHLRFRTDPGLPPDRRPRRPRRTLQARAAINRLLTALGAEEIPG